MLTVAEGEAMFATGVKFFKDSSLLVSASADHTARMWRANEDGSYSAAHVLTVRLSHAPALRP